MNSTRRRTAKSAACILSAAAILHSISAVSYGQTSGELDKLAGSGSSTPLQSSYGDTLWMMVKVIFILLFIIGLFLFIMKFAAKKSHLFTGRGLRSLGGVQLGQNKSLQVVEAGDHVYILGVGDNVQLIDKIDDPEKAAMFIEKLSNPERNANSTMNLNFLSSLAPLLKRKANTEEDQTDSFQEVFHEKMRQVMESKKRTTELLKEEQPTLRQKDKS